MAKLSSKSGTGKRIFSIALVLIVFVLSGIWAARLILQEPTDVPIIRAELGGYKTKPVDASGRSIPYKENELYETINPDENREVVRLNQQDANWEDDIDMLTSPEMTVSVEPVEDIDLIEQAARDKEEDAEIEAAKRDLQENEKQQQNTDNTPNIKADLTENSNTVPEQILQSLIQSQVYQIQLGALPSESQVKQEWNRIRKKFTRDLGSLSLEIQATGNGTGLHRLRAGPLSSYGEAAELCARLVEQKQDCLVVTQ